MNKEIIIISGTNGVGKTTFAKPYIEKIGCNFLNTDEIAKEIEKQGKNNTMIRARKIFFSELRKSVAKNESIVIETKKIRQLKKMHPSLLISPLNPRQ